MHGAYGKASRTPETTRFHHASPTRVCIPDALNSFYAQFVALNPTPMRKSTSPLDNQVQCLSLTHIRKMLSRVNPLEATRPDKTPRWVLIDCEDQLADMLVVQVF